MPLFLGMFWRGGNRIGALLSMGCGFTLAAVLTWFYPDDMPGLGSLTSGVLALGVNLLLYLGCHVCFGQSEQERERVRRLFDAGAPRQTLRRGCQRRVRSGPERTGRVRVTPACGTNAGRRARRSARLGRRPSLRAKVGAFPDLPRSRSTMPDFFGNLIDQILGFARAHEQWLPAIGFAFAFVKSLPLVALFVPGTALLLSIGAVLGSGAGSSRPSGWPSRSAPRWATGSPMRWA